MENFPMERLVKLLIKKKRLKYVLAKTLENSLEQLKKNLGKCFEVPMKKKLLEKFLKEDFGRFHGGVLGKNLRKSSVSVLQLFFRKFSKGVLNSLPGITSEILANISLVFFPRISVEIHPKIRLGILEQIHLRIFPYIPPILFPRTLPRIVVEKIEEFSFKIFKHILHECHDFFGNYFEDFPWNSRRISRETRS